MNAPKVNSWRESMAYANDKEYWRTRVRSMRQRGENKFGQTCGGWQLGAIHGEHLGCSDMLSCKGSEGAIIASVPQCLSQW